MKKISLILMTIMLILILAHGVHAKRVRVSDREVPIVAKYVCSGLCRSNETIYVYENITMPDLCERIGGQMYSHQGYELILACKVMNKRRCKQQDGRMGEFHFPFQPKNYTHLGCTADMKAEQCRTILRTAYASKTTANKYFMNNVGCLAH